jgi:uncharacterized protein YacL (UPF0231 family)
MDENNLNGGGDLPLVEDIADMTEEALCSCGKGDDEEEYGND